MSCISGLKGVIADQTSEELERSAGNFGDNCSIDESLSSEIDAGSVKGSCVHLDLRKYSRW